METCRFEQESHEVGGASLAFVWLGCRAWVGRAATVADAVTSTALRVADAWRGVLELACIVSQG